MDLSSGPTVKNLILRNPKWQTRFAAYIVIVRYYCMRPSAILNFLTGNFNSHALQVHILHHRAKMSCEIDHTIAEISPFTRCTFLEWHNYVKLRDNRKTFCNSAQVWTDSGRVKLWLKTLSRYRKCRKPQGCKFFDSHCSCVWIDSPSVMVTSFFEWKLA